MIVTEEFRDKYFGIRIGTKMRRARKCGVDITVRGWWDRVVGIEIADEYAKELEKGTFKAPLKHKKTKNKQKKVNSKFVPAKATQCENSSETQKFLSEYVYNDEDFDKTMIGYHINRMIHYKNVDWDVIQEKLLRLEHKDFCITNYWRYISAYQIIKHNHHCNRCPRETMLQTHHKTYSHKGREIFFMEQDLEVLCMYCHRQEHGL